MLTIILNDSTVGMQGDWVTDSHDLKREVWFVLTSTRAGKGDR